MFLKLGLFGINAELIIRLTLPFTAWVPEILEEVVFVGSFSGCNAGHLLVVLPQPIRCESLVKLEHSDSVTNHCV